MIMNFTESEQQFIEFFAHHDAIMLLVDHNSGNIIDANKAASTFYGYSCEEFKQKHIHDINQLNSKEIADHIQQALNQKVNTFVFPHQLANGEIKYVKVHSTPITVNNSTRLLSIIHDITEQLQHEQNLKLYSQALEGTSEGVIITNSKVEIIAVNSAFSEITGYSREEAIGKNPKLLSSGKNSAAFYQNIYQSLKQHGRWKGEILNRKKDGSFYPQLSSISRIVNDDHKLTHYVAVMSDISKLKQSQQQLTNLAHYDALTQLPNKLLFTSRLEHAIKKNKRKNNERLGVLVLDLDHFKLINDSLGHIIGDELLCQVAKRLTTRVRQSDTVARFGGDEFIILIEEFEQVTDLVTIAQHIIDDLNRPFELGSNCTHISTSIGIAIYPDDTNNQDKIISFADAAMYKAKENGRNTYSFYTESITQQAEQKLTLTNDLKLAIENNELALYFQPQVCFNTGKIIGAETLLRWQHPNGMIMPDKFIPLAEEIGLINQITLWVFEQGCNQLKKWQQQGLNLSLSLNISAKDWAHADFYSNIETIINDSGIDCSQLDLELTESAIMEKPDEILPVLKQLKALGIQLTLDDFGTGHSSLSYLKYFPLDKLKIDKSFVFDLENSQADKMIVHTIVTMAKNFNLKVVAEGVENKNHIHYLQEISCDYAQGYYYSKPVPIDIFEQNFLNQ